MTSLLLGNNMKMSLSENIAAKWGFLKCYYYFYHVPLEFNANPGMDMQATQSPARCLSHTMGQTRGQVQEYKNLCALQKKYNYYV